MNRRFLRWFFIISKLFAFSSINGTNANTCDLNIVESMPDKLQLVDPADSNVIRTHESLLELIESAQKSIKVASFYWHLTPEPEHMDHPSAQPGLKLMAAVKAATERGVKLEVAIDGFRTSASNPNDLDTLRQIGTLKMVNVTRLLGKGIIHTKFMIVDDESFYLGSSNFDWRAMSQVKEMGVTFKQCQPLAQDLDKIFRTYMQMADVSDVSQGLTDDLKTNINLKNPLQIGSDKTVFLAGSPPAFNGPDNHSIGRTDDIEALLHMIDSAKEFISISVMNYSPRKDFSKPKLYWPRIDDALRRAATTRNVQVNVLFSNWSSTKYEMPWYKSLNALQFRQGGIHVKLFDTPKFDDFQKNLPYARVKHDKYMVTDGGLYVGTSNWTPDYFMDTAGVGLVIRPSESSSGLPEVAKHFKEIFDRDFNSEYAHELQ